MVGEKASNMRHNFPSSGRFFTAERPPTHRDGSVEHVFRGAPPRKEEIMEIRHTQSSLNFFLNEEEVPKFGRRFVQKTWLTSPTSGRDDGGKKSTSRRRRDDEGKKQKTPPTNNPFRYTYVFFFSF